MLFKTAWRSGEGIVSGQVVAWLDAIILQKSEEEISVSSSVLRVLDWMPGLSSWITGRNPTTIVFYMLCMYLPVCQLWRPLHS